MESNKNFPEKLITYTDILRGIGEAALESIKRFFTHAQETELHKPEHYIVKDQPKPNVSVYRALPKADPVVPDIKGLDISYDSEGRYL